MNGSYLRDRYLADAVEVVSAQRLLVMLYDRLWMDLHRAAKAVDDGDFETTNRELKHAQEIVERLQGALDTEVWPAGRNLHDVYTYLLSQLVVANVKKDRRRVEACITIVEPLRDAWHQAVRTAAPGGPTALGSVA
ncbi:MAG TPA: flagellar export chaperone FliS [Acidimicrobiia bacterium]|jgi:flagellar protein FliS